MGLISEKISMSATLKTSIKCELLSTTENLGIINQVEATQNVPCKSLSTTSHLCVHLKYGNIKTLLSL
jgi:hypothetical protein